MTLNKSLQFIEKTAKNTVIIIFGVIMFMLFIASFVTTCTMPDADEVIKYDWDFPLKHLIANSLFIVFALIFKKYCKKDDLKNKILFAGIIGLIAFYAIFILSIHVEPISDQQISFDAAKQFLNGKYDYWKPNGYAGKYPNQNGLILFFALIQKLFGMGNSFIVQIINLVASVVSVCYMAKLSDIAFGVKNKMKTMLILLIFAPMLLYVTFVYGTMLGLCLSIIGIYYQIKFIQKQKWYYAFISSVSIPVAVILKNNYLIVLVASVLIYIAYAICKKKLINIFAAILLVAVYVLSNFGVTSFIEKKTEFELSDGVPTIAWIAMGISENERGPGWWSGYNETVYLYADCDTETAHKQAIVDMINRINVMKEDLTYTASFFARKILSMWSEPSFQSLWIQFVKSHPNDFPEWINSLFAPDGSLNKIYIHFFDIFQTSVYFFALYYLIERFKKIELYQLLPAIIMIGGFLFHILWEAKGQYSVTYFFLIIPYAICGFNDFTNTISKKTNKVR